MLEQKHHLEDKCAKQTTLLSEKEAEITHLRSLLSLKEIKAAEAIRERDALSEKVATLESMTTSKETELASLTAQVTQLTSDLSGFQLSRDELSSKVAFLESERGSLADQKSSLESAFELFRERMEATQDEQAKCIQYLEYCHALGHAIGYAVNKGIQDGLRAGVDHGKSRRDLSVIEACDPSTEAKYIDVVNALGSVDFSLLSKLKSKKDASIVDLMDSLRFEGPLAEIPRAKDLQPSLEQLRLLIHRPEDNVVLGETSLSFSFQVVHSQVQRVKGEIMDKRLSLMDVMVPLVEPLSS
ncbi:hypothetical protein Tco_0316610 [Tanacetum coccineum]